MDSNLPPVLSLGDESQNENTPNAVSPFSLINYAAATTASFYNFAPLRPYPPVNQIGPVEPHDRPYFEYRHKDKQTIAKEKGFDLNGKCKTDNRKMKHICMNVQSFAITCWSTVSKEKLLNDILNEFGLENSRCVCVAREVAGVESKPHLYGQIILNEPVNKTSWFLDKYPGR